jgi:hypothetical protein
MQNAKLRVRKALLPVLVSLRAGNDVELATEALELERQYRGEIAKLEKEEKELQLELQDHAA